MKIRMKIKKWLESISDESIDNFAEKLCNFFNKPLLKAFLVIELFVIANDNKLPFLREILAIYVLYKIFDKPAVILNIDLKTAQSILKKLKEKYAKRN